MKNINLFEKFNMPNRFFLEDEGNLKRVWDHIKKKLTIEDYKKIKKEIEIYYPAMKDTAGFAINQLITRETGGGSIELLLRIEHDFTKFLGLKHKTQLETLEDSGHPLDIPSLL